MNKTLKLIIGYTIIFGIVTAGVFLLFILSHKSFIQYGDGYRQGYFWLVENKNNIDSLLSGDGFPRWSWSKGLGTETQFITNPFYLIGMLFKPGYLELGYTVTLIAELYCCGLAFIAFGKEVCLTDFQCLLGAITYAFCGWGIDAALVQESFVIKMVILPLLILSVDRIYKGKSPILFIAMVAYHLMSGVYFAYMAAIGVIVYMLVRYAYYHDGFSIKEYAQTIGRFVLYGVIGVITSAVILIPSVELLLGATIDSASDGFGLFYTQGHYMSFGRFLLSQAATTKYVGGYSFMGLSAIVLMAVPVAFRKFSIKSTPAVMTAISGIMFIFPFFSSMMNGFGYVSNRWFFIAIFFIIWAGVSSFDLEKLSETKNIVIMLIALAVMFIWTIGFDQIGLISIGGQENAYILLNIFSGLVALFIIFVSVKGGKTAWKKLSIVGVCCITLMVSWNVAFKDNIYAFVFNNQINKQLERSTQRVANQIEDDGFFRTDQVNGIVNNRLLGKPANENLWWQTRTLYTYDSKIPERMLYLNKLVGNNYGYSERVYMLSNDNRMGMDFLMGVKYFLGTDTVAEHYTPDLYAGYGFSKTDVIDGVNIWENKYDTGIGFGYDKIIAESEFEKLGRLEREQAILQAAVIDDEDMKELESAEVITAEDVVTDVKNIGYEIKSTDGLTIKDGKITTDKEMASMTLSMDKPSKGQLIVSFDGLVRLFSDGSEGNYFKLYAKSGEKEKSNNYKSGNQTIGGIEDYDINLGYNRNYSEDITISFSDPGTYVFDELRLSDMSVENYDTYAAERMDYDYKVTSFSDRNVSGSVDMPKDGIVFFSIYAPDNWDVYVDGEKQELIHDVNVAFAGVEVSAGQHDIELRYDFGYIKKGLAVSLVGLLLMIATHIIYRKRRKTSDSI